MARPHPIVGPVRSVSYSVLVLLMVLLCKGLAYSTSLSSFRSGPIFPSILLATVGGVAILSLPGSMLAPVVAMRIGPLCMVRLPLTSISGDALLESVRAPSRLTRRSGWGRREC